eukprot:3239609-Prymnesium_polylepis.1
MACFTSDGQVVHSFVSELYVARCVLSPLCVSAKFSYEAQLRRSNSTPRHASVKRLPASSCTTLLRSFGSTSVMLRPTLCLDKSELSTFDDTDVDYPLADLSGSNIHSHL